MREYQKQALEKIRKDIKNGIIFHPCMYKYPKPRPLNDMADGLSMCFRNLNKQTNKRG